MRGHLVFSPTELLLWFMFVICLLRDPTSNKTSAMYTVNLRTRNHLEQGSSPLFQIRQLFHNFGYRHRTEQTEISGLRITICTAVPIRSAKYVTTQLQPTPPRPAPPRACISPTRFQPGVAHGTQLNASVAWGDTKSHKKTHESIP